MVGRLRVIAHAALEMIGIKMEPIDNEAEWLVTLPEDKRVLFLASLSHALTIAGRSSYKPQTEDLEKPKQLRSINEIQHRVAACLCQLLVGQCELSFQRSIASWILHHGDSELQGLLTWSWHTTKERLET